MAHLLYNQHLLQPSQTQDRPQNSAPLLASYNAANHAQNTDGQFTLPGLGFFAQEEDTSHQEEPMTLDDDEDEEYYNLPSLKHVDSVGQDSRVAAITLNRANDASSKNKLSNGHGSAYIDAASKEPALNSSQPVSQRSAEQEAVSDDFSLPGLGALVAAPSASQQASHVGLPSRNTLPQPGQNNQQSSKQDLRKLLETQYAFAVQTLRELHACGISFEQLIALDLLDARDKANLAELFVQAGLSDGGVPSVRSLNQELLNMISLPSDMTNNGRSVATSHADAAAPYSNGTSSAVGIKANPPAGAPIPKSQPSSRQGLSSASSTPLGAPNPSVQTSTLLTPAAASAPGDRLSYLERLQKAKAKKSPSLATPTQFSTPPISQSAANALGGANSPASLDVEKRSQLRPAVVAGSLVMPGTPANNGVNFAPPSVPMTLKERLRQKIRQLKESPVQDPVAAVPGDSIEPPHLDSDIVLGASNSPAAGTQEIDTTEEPALSALPGLSAQPSQDSVEDLDEDDADSDDYEPSDTLPARVEEVPICTSSQGFNLTPSAWVRSNPMEVASQSNTPTPGGGHATTQMNAVLRNKEAELLEMKARLKAKLDQKKKQKQLASVQRTSNSTISSAAQGKSHAEPIDLTDEDAIPRAANDIALQMNRIVTKSNVIHSPSIQKLKNVARGTENNEDATRGVEKASVTIDAGLPSTMQERSSVSMSPPGNALSISGLASDHQDLLSDHPLTDGRNLDAGVNPIADIGNSSIVEAAATADLRPTSVAKRHAEEPLHQTLAEKHLRPSSPSTLHAGTPLSAKAQRYAELQRQMKELQAAMAAEESEEVDDAMQIERIAVTDHDKFDDPSKLARQGELCVSSSASASADVQMSDADAVGVDNVLDASHLPKTDNASSIASLPPTPDDGVQHLPGESSQSTANSPSSHGASGDKAVESEENVPMEIEEIEVSSEETTTGGSDAGIEEHEAKQGADYDTTVDASEAVAPINNTSDIEDGELDEYEPSFEIPPIADGISAPDAVLAQTSDPETRRKSLTDESMAESSEEGEISSGVEEIAPPVPRPPPTQPRNFHAEQRQPRFNNQSPRGQYSQQNRRPQQMHSGPSTPRPGVLANRPPQLPILGLPSEFPPTLTKMDSTEGKDVVREMKSSAGSFKKYESPLRIFKSFRYHPEYSKTEGGYQSLTYSNRLEPDIALCPNELETGSCKDPTCPYQHIEKMRLDGSSLLAELGGQNPGRTEEERQTYITGLRKLIQDMKARNLESAEQIASEIVGYRRDFLQDSTRILAFDEKKA